RTVEANIVVLFYFFVRLLLGWAHFTSIAAICILGVQMKMAALVWGILSTSKQKALSTILNCEAFKSGIKNDLYSLSKC
ncbi:hypothetical protein ACJX0J_027331, partial [Zea mays]